MTKEVTCFVCKAETSKRKTVDVGEGRRACKHHHGVKGESVKLEKGKK